MIEHKPFDVSDLENLDDLKGQPTEGAKAKTFVQTYGERPAPVVPAYKCDRCRGSGKVTIGYVNLRRVPCNACHGRGVFDTSPEERAKARAYREARKDAAASELRNQVEAWKVHATRGNSFATSLLDSLHKYGSLTENQLAAVVRNIERDAERAKAQATTNAAQVAAGGLDLTAVPSGYYAVPDGDTRLKIRVNHVTKGNWIGYTFVDDGAAYGQRISYGRQKPGGRYLGKVEEQLRAIAADPKAASTAYGKLVGRCGVCGRLLEDEVSVAAGIGPVCAGRLGWGD